MVVNIDEYLKNFDLNVDYNSFVLLMGILGAVFGAIFFGAIVHKIKHKKFTRMLILTNGLSLVIFIMLIASFLLKNIPLLVLMITVFNFVNSPILTLATEMSCITSFPIGEGLVAGVQVLLTAIFTFLIILLSAFFMDSKRDILYF